MAEEDSRKGSGGKRKRVAADDGEDEKRKTRSTAEPDWVGRVMDGIDGILRTMEENEKRAQSFRRGLESRLQVMEGNMVGLGRMVKVGVNTIMVDQYELRMAIERDDEVTEDENDGSDEGDKETKEDEKDEEKDGEDEEKDGEDNEMVDEAKGDGEDEAEVMAEVTAEMAAEGAAEATAETTSEAALSSPA